MKISTILVCYFCMSFLFFQGKTTEAFKCHSTCHDGEMDFLAMSTYCQHYVDMAR